MIITSFQYNLVEVIESSLKFKFNVPSMEKLTSTVKKKKKKKTRYLTSLNDSFGSPKHKRHKDSSNSEDAILGAFNIAEASPRKSISSYLSYPNPINSMI